MTGLKKQGLPLALIVLAIAVYGYAGSFPPSEGGDPGPQVFPRLIALLIGGLAVLRLVLQLGWQNMESPERSEPKLSLAWWTSGSMKRCYVFLALIIGLVVAFEWLGAYSATALFLLSSFFFLSKRTKYKFICSFIFSIAFTGAVYLVFERIFSIPLPTGIFI